MTTREERAAGRLSTGELDAKRFGERIGVAHGTIKRWLHEGLPARREQATGHGSVWIDVPTAEAWIAERFKGRRTVAFHRRGFVYFVEREDGAIKIGWSSDVMRRVHELRKKSGAACQLVVCYPGDKPDELRLHKTFEDCLIGDEWFRPEEHLSAFIDALKERAA